MAKNSCIYKITNILNGKIYVGSAIDFIQRKSLHISQLNKNKHHSKYLQNSWNKYGMDKFIFEIIESIEILDLLLTREQFYLDNLLFANLNDNRFNELGYNICRIAGNWLGQHHSKESKLKISLKNMNRVISDETRKKMRESSTHIKGKEHSCYGKKMNKESIIKQKNTFVKNYKKENHSLYNKKIIGVHLEKLKEASIGSNNPMYKTTVLDIWIKKYGELIAKEKWNKTNTLRSINGLGKGTKKVIQKDRDNNRINEFNSITEASTQTNTNINSITQVCKGKKKIAGGFLWEYIIINNNG